MARIFYFWLLLIEETHQLIFIERVSIRNLGFHHSWSSVLKSIRVGNWGVFIRYCLCGGWIDWNSNSWSLTLKWFCYLLFYRLVGNFHFFNIWFDHRRLVIEDLFCLWLVLIFWVIFILCLFHQADHWVVLLPVGNQLFNILIVFILLGCICLIYKCLFRLHYLLPFYAGGVALNNTPAYLLIVQPQFLDIFACLHWLVFKSK